MRGPLHQPSPGVATAFCFNRNPASMSLLNTKKQIHNLRLHWLILECCALFCVSWMETNCSFKDFLQQFLIVFFFLQYFSLWIFQFFFFNRSHIFCVLQLYQPLSFFSCRVLEVCVSVLQPHRNSSVMHRRRKPQRPLLLLRHESDQGQQVRLHHIPHVNHSW